MCAGTGTVNAAQFGAAAARCMAIAYDYTVFAGTQGVMNHKKTDRMLQLAEQWRLPLVLFAEGGGGRPGDYRQDRGREKALRPPHEPFAAGGGVSRMAVSMSVLNLASWLACQQPAHSFSFASIQASWTVALGSAVRA